MEPLDIILFNTIIFGYHNDTHSTQKHTYDKHTKLNRLERSHFELFNSFFKQLCCELSLVFFLFFCYHNTNSSKSLTLLLHFLSLGLTKSKSTKHELLLIIKSPFRKLGAFDTSTCTSDVQFAIHAFPMFIALKLSISDPKYKDFTEKRTIAAFFK